MGDSTAVGESVGLVGEAVKAVLVAAGVGGYAPVAGWAGRLIARK